jgi:hypothetical protein
MERRGIWFWAELPKKEKKKLPVVKNPSDQLHTTFLRILALAPQTVGKQKMFIFFFKPTFIKKIDRHLCQFAYIHFFFTLSFVKAK